MERKRKTECLVNRLRAPIDPTSSTIHPYNAISNQGLRQLADKLDAIGIALAYVIEKKHAKVKTKKARRKTPLK